MGGAGKAKAQAEQRRPLGDGNDYGASHVGIIRTRYEFLG